MVQPLSRVASIAKLLPAGHHLYLAGGIASLNRPAKFGFFPAGKELSRVAVGAAGRQPALHGWRASFHSPLQWVVNQE